MIKKSSFCVVTCNEVRLVVVFTTHPQDRFPGLCDVNLPEAGAGEGTLGGALVGAVVGAVVRTGVGALFTGQYLLAPHPTYTGWSTVRT